MGENLYITMAINSENTLFVNSEAHESRKLLHHRSSDEDNDDDDEEECIEEEEEEEEADDDELEVDEEDIKAENDDDDALVVEFTDENHSKSPPTLPSSLSSPSYISCGRGSRSKFRVIVLKFIYFS